MGMMVGGFFAAAAASSLSQIDVKPRTQHVKYFISTLIHILSLRWLLAARLSMYTATTAALFIAENLLARRSTQSTDVS
jgi:hypothetical protein